LPEIADVGYEAAEVTGTRDQTSRFLIDAEGTRENHP
jgi:hypothetical protein